MKLFAKYNRINVISMSLVFVISGIIYYLIINGVLIHELDEALGEYENRVENYVSINDSLPVFRNFEEVEVDYHAVENKLSRAISSVERFDPEEKKNGTYRQLVFYQTVDGKIYEIKVAKPVEGTTLLTNTIAYSTLAMLLLIILISIILNRVILQKLWRPFYATVDEMKRFKLGGDTIPSLPDSTIDEFTLMNRSLLEVVSAAKDDYRALKEFTENASHEMQTPLAIIRSKLDLVIQEEGLSIDQGLALKSAYSGIRRLTKLNQSLLLLTKIENEQFVATDTIDMRSKLEEKIEQFAELWAGQNISSQVELNPSTLTVNPELIEILLNNLLSNASRHNLEGGNIKIVLDKQSLYISNSAQQGALDREKLFNRFYKQNQSSQNNGLGLAIVQQISGRSAMTIEYDFEADHHIFKLMW